MSTHLNIDINKSVYLFIVVSVNLGNQTFSHLLLDIVFSCEVIIKESTVLYLSHRKYRGSRPRARTCQQSFEHSHTPHWMEYTRDHLNMPIISAFSTTMYRPIGFLISEISMYSLHVKNSCFTCIRYL